MKVKLILIGILLLILVVLALFALGIFTKQPATSPTQTGTSQTATSTGAAQQVIDAAIPQIRASGEVNPQSGGARVVMPYALVAWSNDNEGGEALMQYVAPDGWTLVSLGGGTWDATSLEEAGVPATIAQQLAGN